MRTPRYEALRPAEAAGRGRPQAAAGGEGGLSGGGLRRRNDRPDGKPAARAAASLWPGGPGGLEPMG